MLNLTKFYKKSVNNRVLSGDEGVTSSGGKEGGGVLLNRQNLLSVTKVICQWSLKSNELFLISHDYESENVHDRQNFWQNLKDIRD